MKTKLFILLFFTSTGLFAQKAFNGRVSFGLFTKSPHFVLKHLIYVVKDTITNKIVDGDSIIPHENGKFKINLEYDDMYVVMEFPKNPNLAPLLISCRLDRTNFPYEEATLRIKYPKRILKKHYLKGRQTYRGKHIFSTKKIETTSSEDQTLTLLKPYYRYPTLRVFKNTENPFLIYRVEKKTNKIEGYFLLNDGTNAIRIVLYPRSEWKKLRKLYDESNYNSYVHDNAPQETEFKKEKLIYRKGKYRISLNTSKTTFYMRKTYYQLLDHVKVRRLVLY